MSRLFSTLHSLSHFTHSVIHSFTQYCWLAWSIMRQQIFSSQHGLGRASHLLLIFNSPSPGAQWSVYCFAGDVYLRSVCGRLYLSMRRTWSNHLHLLCFTLVLSAQRFTHCSQIIVKIPLRHLPSNPLSWSSSKFVRPPSF